MMDRTAKPEQRHCANANARRADATDKITERREHLIP